MTEFLLCTFVKDAQNTADRAVRSACGNLACIVGIVCNVLLFLGKFIVGTLFGSLSITAVRRFEDLPQAAQDYVAYIEKVVGCKIKYISVGPERDACIVR